MGLPPLCVARPYFDKEVIKRALILNLNIHHALKLNNTHNTLKIISQYKKETNKTQSKKFIKHGKVTIKSHTHGKIIK